MPHQVILVKHEGMTTPLCGHRPAGFRDMNMNVVLPQSHHIAEVQVRFDILIILIIILLIIIIIIIIIIILLIILIIIIIILIIIIIITNLCMQLDRHHPDVAGAPRGDPRVREHARLPLALRILPGVLRGK
jgi:fatty acid desaturase